MRYNSAPRLIRLAQIVPCQRNSFSTSPGCLASLQHRPSPNVHATVHTPISHHLGTPSSLPFSTFPAAAAAAAAGRQPPKMTKMRALVTVEEPTAAVREIARPTPAAGEILVRVHYAAQNPTDWKAVPERPAGRLVGCDFAGTVADANGSAAWREGQRVAGFVHGTRADPPRGAYAEYLATEASMVWAVPDAVSFRDAATVSLAFATAVQAMFQRLGLPEPGTTTTTTAPAAAAAATGAPTPPRRPFLVNGGTSSVGQYAVQLAKLAGLYVIATGSAKNHGLLTSLGADRVVDYRDPAWPEEVRALSRDGLRHALDCISERETTGAVARAMSSAEGGHVVCVLPRSASELPGGLGKVRVESTIVYTVFGLPIDLSGSGFENWGGPTPTDREFWERYMAHILPGYLESGKIKPNPSRELGGLEAILEGFEMQIQGKVSAEKLVYKIAE
ncbi:putative zinc-binding dehydrogenase [Rosellinia necatrix]|uniref:Putative zinc-binding dehydrogenase n=1 Tax=Rosellinia necatrix TaxID=77044 RepID=A0A1W2TQ24_ROSNE|nr:putative zinc-binding dehydrogenase [Rosellinia necatrix]